MKKVLLMMAMAVCAISLPSCSNDDDDDGKNKLEDNFFTIANSTYHKGEQPKGTISEALEGIDMSSQVMNGAMNYISVVTTQDVDKFYLGVKGVNGYLEYTPADVTSSGEYNSYVIPVMISESYTGNSTIVLNAALANGDITAASEKQIEYIETMPGAIEVKLAFSNNKDVDLHLYTPSGKHIYFGDRGGIYTDENGNQITYGLDIDSNAACNIDGINKENIYIPQELVENGTYKVIVNMYENCDRSIATNWSIITRYQGKIITPASGSNPASGVYAIGAGNSDNTVAMTFTISGAGNRSEIAAKTAKWSFRPATLTDNDIAKIEEAQYRESLLK